MLMEYNAEILRGWPQEGARESVETIKASATLVNGDLVEMQSDGTVDLVSSTASDRVGLVIRGNGDSTSSVNTNKAVVLWGNYIVKVSSAKFTAASWAVGDKVTGKSGKFTKDAGSDPIIGFVKKVQAAVTGSETAHLVIVVK
jgi:hypothetical protein